LLGPSVGVQHLCTRPPCNIKGGRPLENDSTPAGQRIDSFIQAPIHHTVDVGYYAPAARTTLNAVCSCVLAPGLDRPNSLALLRVLPLREYAGAFRHPAVGTPKSLQHLAPSVGMCPSIGQIFAHLLASKVELILCNDNEKMEGGTVLPAPQALTPRQQLPRCGGARQRGLLCVATTTPQGRHDGAQGWRLLRVALRYPDVGSRFSLKQPPGALYGGMASAQGFLSRWGWSRRL